MCADRISLEGAMSREVALEATRFRNRCGRHYSSPPCGFLPASDAGSQAQSASIDRLTASASTVACALHARAVRHRATGSEGVQRKPGEARMRAAYRLPHRIRIEAAIAGAD